MTSNDVPAPGAGTSGGRRRVLGRGPGAPRVEPVAPPQDPAPAETPPETAAPEPDPSLETVSEHPNPAAPVPVAGRRSVGVGPGAQPGAVAPKAGRSAEAVDPEVVREPEAVIPGAGSEFQGEDAAVRRSVGVGPGAEAGVLGPEAVSARSAEAVDPEVVREPEAVIPGAGSEFQAEDAAGRRSVGVGPGAEAGVLGPEAVSARSTEAAAPEVVRESEAVAPETVREPEGRIPGAGSEPRTEAVVPGYPDESGGAPPGGGAGAEAVPGEGDGGGVFKVRLANFEGPFDLLLQLISKHKLDVTEVALSKVTDEFMAHIRAMGPDWDLDQTTEFLVVAATLLDLKAARLLPSAEVEDEADLALLEARDLLFARLLQYRAYKQIADIFNQRLDEEARRYPRTVGLEPHHAELLPEVVISIGAEGFAKLAVKAMQPKPKPQVYVDHIHAPLVSVQEQAGIVVARLRELGEASFRALVEDTDDTLTVVARFLALLELYREKAVALDQETALGELIVRWTGGEGEAQPMVTDEFDRPPEPPKEDKA